jgi:hypothetical protein
VRSLSRISTEAARLVRRPFEDPSWKVSDDAPASLDRGTLIREHPGMDDVIDAGMTLSVVAAVGAADHLDSLATLVLPNNKSVFGCLAAARMAVEGFALACWMLDPSLDAAGRLERAVAVRVDELYSAEQLMERLGAGSDVLDQRRVRLDSALRQAQELGVPMTERDGDLLGVRHPPPRPHERVGAFLNELGHSNGPGIYSALSGVVHTQPVVLLSMRDEVLAPSATKPGLVQLRLQLRDAATAVDLAVSAAYHCARLLHTHLGLDDGDVLGGAERRAADVLAQLTGLIQPSAS